MINVLFTAFALIAAGQAEGAVRQRDGGSLERQRIAPLSAVRPLRETDRDRD